MLNASGAKMKDQTVEKVSISLSIRWSLQSAGKNGIADTLKYVEPIRHGIVFLHMRCFLKIRRFNTCEINAYLGGRCLSMPVPTKNSGIIDFITTP